MNVAEWIFHVGCVMAVLKLLVTISEWWDTPVDPETIGTDVTPRKPLTISREIPDCLGFNQYNQQVNNSCTSVKSAIEIALMNHPAEPVNPNEAIDNIFWDAVGNDDPISTYGIPKTKKRLAFESQRKLKA